MVIWRGTGPIEVSGKRSNGEGSPVGRAEVFGVLLKEKTCDFFWVGDSSPVCSLFGMNVVSWNFELGDHGGLCGFQNES